MGNDGLDWGLGDGNEKERVEARDIVRSLGHAHSNSSNFLVQCTFLIVCF
jgi:hypothetical protein